jgi:hypothetical protein
MQPGLPQTKGTEMQITGQPPKAKVAPARKLITKPKDLFAEYEGKHIALLPLGFAERTFEGDNEPTTLAEVAVVDVETEPVRPVAALQISWRRVVGALRLVDLETWQIGKLEREAGQTAVEFGPPDPTFNLGRVASQLGQLVVRNGSRPLGLAVGESARDVIEPTPGDAGA